MGEVHLLARHGRGVQEEIVALLSPLYGRDEAAALCRWILEEVTAVSFDRLQPGDGALSEPQICRMEYAVGRLLDQVPVQYVFGHTLWKGLDLQVTADTLIPRPETAELADWVLQQERMTGNARVLDAGTGSGCIAIALKAAREDWQVTGTDCNERALTVAEQNGKNNRADVRWQKDDLLHPVAIQHIQWDIVVSNPPYIPLSEKKSMPENVTAYEPQEALFVPDDNPLLFYRSLTALSFRKIYVEVHERMSEQVAELFRQTGCKDVMIRKDIYNKARMVYGRKD